MILKDIPWPPQSNNCYATSKSGHRFPSKELVEFKMSMAKYNAEWDTEISALSFYLKKELKDNNNFVVIDLYFAAQAKDIWTKKGEVKKWDASNRIKAIHDSLSNLLEVDDSRFFIGETEKVVTLMERHCIARFRIKKIRSAAEILR